MEDLRRAIHESSTFIRQTIEYDLQVGIILGTGLGKLVDEVSIDRVLSYEDIPHFPVSTVESHSGNLILGELSGKKVAVMQGRFHYYEGFSMKEVTFPVRVMCAMGIGTLMISNAAGGMGRHLRRGDLMMITDHINLLPDNPLRGPNDQELGPRFLDVLDAYDYEYRELAHHVGIEQKLDLKEGVYAALSGPNFETPAEYRYLVAIGADAVGMSTVPEVLVARHGGMRVFAVSCITDMAIGGNAEKVSHEIVIQAANEAQPKLTCLFSEMVGGISL